MAIIYMIDVLNFNPIVLLFFISILFFLWYEARPKTNKRHTFYINSAIRCYKKLSTFENKGQQIMYLRKINPFIFEELILYGLNINGYKIIRNEKYSNDGGIDGKFFLNDKLVFIQAKRYGKHINKQHVIDFENICRQNNVSGIFCHTGKTGEESKDIFKKSDVVNFYSGNKLLNLIFKGEL